MKSRKLNKLYFFLLVIASIFTFCKTENQDKKDDIANVNTDSLLYFNHSDSAKYVGMNTCKLCHQNIYNTFIKTGMGKSFDIASKSKSSAKFEHSSIYDEYSDLHYRAFWNNDSLYISEFRLDKKDTTFSRNEQVNYIIGSGQHTNSHLQSVNGYINQMPMTYYTQKGKWDLPPGFENGVNTRFSRKIGVECMSCHNGFPDFVIGSENKYRSVPQGIDCERCHGPGSIHVAKKQQGEIVDTSKYIDRSIVNPSKLSIDLQFDICQRCHLQGNAVLKAGRSFFDFKPGMKLSDHITVFLPKYKNADDEFIMASHADRLKQSACFIKSLENNKKINSLKPYKNALTCVTCHNPHVSVRETNTEVFNDACKNCHNETNKNTCKDKNYKTAFNARKGHAPSEMLNCVNCHMPASGSIDIPHVSVHDHYIRKPISAAEKKKIKLFIGLFAVNEKHPDRNTIARAYLNQYEKFEQKNEYLDSALVLLNYNSKIELTEHIHELIQLYFIKQNYRKIIGLINEIGQDELLNKKLIHMNQENKDAWACYRIAESYNNVGETRTSILWFKQAIKLAPFNLDFRNKYASALAINNQIKEAINEYEFILKENPKTVSPYTNLGYIKLIQGDKKGAFKMFSSGLKLNPDDESLLMNVAAYYISISDKKNALNSINRILKRNPKNIKAQQALKQIQALY